MSEPADTRIYYEQPLNERIRAFLRLEYLFARAYHALSFPDPWASRTTLDSLIDVLAVVSRIDLKKELIKELERHAATLESLVNNPKVDPGRLAQVLTEVRTVLGPMRSNEYAIGHELRGNELVNAVRQRSSIPAGTCEFDLPAYTFWLRQPAEWRNRDLAQWLAAFDLLYESVALCLRLLRESAVATREVAPAGFFQRTLDASASCQMLRVALPPDAPWYPEISAGRHRFTVRFMRLPDPAARASQTDEDVTFELLCCMM